MEAKEINIDVLSGEILRIAWDGTKVFETCEQITKKVDEYANQQVKKLNIQPVINRRELLIDFLNYHLENNLDGTEANWIGKTVDDYLKSINSL